MTRPELRELECFVAAAEHLNFSRAARTLNLSQPPLTRHIKALEEKVGARLFERNTHAVSLTDLGRLYLEDARAILSHMDRAQEALQRATQGETTRLRLAFIGALLDEMLLRLIRRFRESHPDCQVQVVDLPPSAQLAALRSGQLEGGFVGALPSQATRDLTFTVWSEEPFTLALPEKHPLASRKPLRWRDLSGLPWVLVSRAAAPAFRQLFTELAEKHKLSPRIVEESERVPAILTMVAAGNGVSMVPQSVRHLISGGICFRKLPAPTPILRQAFAHRAKHISPALTAFLILLRGLKRATN